MAVAAVELDRNASPQTAPARSGPRSLSREDLRRRPVTGREVPFRDGELIVSRTDPRGVITYINPYFCEISGYTPAELIGQPHNIIRHPDMPPEAFADFWATLKKGRPWVGMVKNRCKNGDHYWVEAHVTPLVDERGELVGYQSVRRKPSRARVEEAERDYAALRAGRLQGVVLRNGHLVRVPWWERLNPLWKLSLPVRLALFALFGPALALVLMLRLGGAHALDWGLWGAGLAFLLYSAWWLSRDVVGRLEEAREALRRIERNDFTGPIDVSRSDEVGRILQEIKSLQIRLGFEVHGMAHEKDRVQRIVDGLETASSGVLLTDAKGQIVFANRTLLQLLVRAGVLAREEADLVMGQPLTALHPSLATWQAVLDGLTGERHELVDLGDRACAVLLKPSLNASGERIGSVLEWRDRTEELALEDEIGQVVEAAARGELGRRLDEAGKHGFFRQVTRSLNTLLDGLQGALAGIQYVLQGLAEGDLTRRVEGEWAGAFGQMADDANRTVEALTRIIGEIRAASDSIGAAAGEIAAGNSDLSARTEQQAAALEETASSMEELTSTVKQNADNARQANQLAQGAASVAESGGQVVQQVVSTMSEIQAASRRIADIIGVIDGIAFQTNILALNAAVEAARAGEQGRGFAVVAAEVRALAQRSANAAKEIKQLITDSVVKVEEGSLLVDQAGRTMGEIVGSVQRVTDIMADISAASQEQSAGIEQVNQAITQMDEGTQQNAALVEQAAASAESMRQQAEALAEAVAAFRLAAQQQASARAAARAPAPAHTHAHSGAAGHAQEGTIASFEDMIEKHAQWKLRLKTYLRGGGEPLDPDTVQKDSVCALGQWLYGKGEQVQHLPEYQKLKEHHRQFHAAAAQVVREHQRGRTAQAQALLDGEFTRKTQETVTAIRALRDAVEGGRRKGAAE
ncbi:methyl-accepting chemotaxis protein [Thermomonas sp.]|uniref:methyl-accepting chemotaxis protein n=1 Tax=Thermomonas sp. TaxID=1971895 RepID=UPI00391CEA4C